MREHLDSPGCCTLRNNATVWAVGTHHKSGTLLGKQLHAMWSEEFSWNAASGATQGHLPPSCHPPNVTFKLQDCGNLGFYGYALKRQTLLSLLQITELTPANARPFHHGSSRGFRLVHIIRDPVAMCVSGYWYHRTGAELISYAHRKDPLLLRNLNLSQGLIVNAQSQLPIITTMVQLVKTLAADRQVLTLGLEDFSSSWNATARVLAKFMFPAEEGLGALAKRFLARPTPFKDESARTNASNLAISHFAKRADELLAFSAIEQSAHPVWRQMQSFRPSLGYVNYATGDPDGWRYAPSRLRDASGQVRTAPPHTDTYS